MNIIKTDIYDVKSYTDQELYNILDLINPSDRELEAKIIFYIRKYQEINSNDSVKLETFFQDIYSHFFITEEFKTTSESESEKNIIEGFDVNISDIKLNKKPVDNTLPIITNNPNQSNPFFNKPNPSIIKDTNNPNSKEINYTNTLTYAPNNLNPLLKQTIKRMVVIDSQFREWQKSFSTNFTVNFSEVLKDVVSLSLTSFQIPYTWYTINKDYGSNFFYIKGNSPGIDNGEHDYQIAIPPGNYTSTTLNDMLHTSINNLKQTYTDVCFNNTDIIYNTFNCKSTINVGITDIYDYSNYRFSFGKWETPIQPSQTIGVSSVLEEKKNIASFLGFNYKEYSTNSFYSLRTISKSILTSGSKSYTIDTSNNKISVIQYWNDSNSDFDFKDYNDYSNNNLKYNTINIILEPKEKSSASDIIKDVNAKMESSQNFEKSSILTLENIEGPINNSGNAFFKWTIKLNRMKTVNQQNAKTVVLLPNIEYDQIWVGSFSLFSFDSSINELNNLISETPIDISEISFNNVGLRLSCNLPRYDLSINDISYQIPNRNLSLNQFIDLTNNHFFKYVGDISTNYNYKHNDLTTEGVIKRKIDLTGSTVFLNNESKIEFVVDIVLTIYGTEFTYDLLNGIFDISSVFKELKDSEVVFNENDDKIYIKKYSGKIHTISGLIEFPQSNAKIITITSTSTYISDYSYNVLLGGDTIYTIQSFSDAIIASLKDYNDNGSFPLNSSEFTFSQSEVDQNNGVYSFTLQIIIKKTIIESNYELFFYDINNNNNISDSIWYKEYNLISDELVYRTDISYNLDDFTVNINSPITQFKPPESINTTTVYDLSAIYLKFECITNGYNVTGNDFSLNIPDASYTLLDFCEKFNHIIEEQDISSAFNVIDISSTSLEEENNKLIFNFGITNHLNNINIFDVSLGHIFKNNNLIFRDVLPTTISTSDAKTMIYSGKIFNSTNYTFPENLSILELSSNNLNYIKDISYNINLNAIIQNKTRDEVFTLIRDSIQNYQDVPNSLPLSNSTITHDTNGNYEAEGFVFLFDYSKWTITSPLLNGSTIEKGDEVIHFNINRDDSSLRLDYVNVYDTSLSSITGIELNFDISYNTDSISYEDMTFNVYNLDDDYSRITVIDNMDTDISMTRSREINILLNGEYSFGSYNVKMIINSGNKIQFKLLSGKGKTDLYMKNFSYKFYNFPIYYDWSMNICLDKIITQNEYAVQLSDIHMGDNTNSIWCNYFGYNILKDQLIDIVSSNPISENIKYTLSEYSDTKVSAVKSKYPIESISIDLSENDENNLLYLKPYIGTKGVYDNAGRNDLSFNVPDIKYTSAQNLINTINGLFNANPITKGTIMSILSSGYCKIRWNINKVFTTDDYKLVFYDTTSFVKCFIGNSSYRNSSPDTTLGWILGFHALTQYILKDGDYISSENYYINSETDETTGNSYNITYMNDVSLSGPIKQISLTGDTTVTVDLYKYLMIIIDDYTQNHLNDGLVTIAQKDTSLVLPSYASRSKYQCDPITGNVVNTGITSGSQNNLTQNQIYSINQIINAQNTKISLISAGPFVKDVFAMIPLDIAGMQPGQIFTDKATAVQDRVYFGPVNIHKLAVKLINDKGDVLDLNGSNWSLQLMCEQLYQATPSNNNIKTDSSNLM
jgi:hypothetical protein